MTQPQAIPAPTETPLNGAPAPGAAPPVDPAAPPPAEGAPAAPAAAPDPKEGEYLSQLRAREVKLVQQQQAEARKRQEFESYKANSERELAAQRAAADLAKRDPLAFLRGTGWTDEQIAARIMSGGQPTEVEQRDALRRELDELKSWKTQREQAETTAKQQAALDAAFSEFQTLAKGGADKWPLANRVKPERLKTRALEIAREHGSRGVALTDPELLDKLEEELSEFVPKSTVTASHASATSQPPPQAPSGQVTQPAPTLTNRAAAAAVAEVTSLPPDADPETVKQFLLNKLADLRAKGLIRD